MASQASSETWLSQLHALLQVLSPGARRQVIEHWMSEPQRASLEQWVLASLGKHTPQECLDVEGRSAAEHSLDESSCTPVVTRSRNITTTSDLHAASVYVRWLEITGPTRKEYDDAVCDQIMLSDVENCLSSSTRDVSVESYDWAAIENVIRSHGGDPSLLRGRVLFPAGFWLGTRLATPRIALKDALETWHELRRHPMWLWWRAAHCEDYIFQPRSAGTTLQDLWESFRSDYIRASVQAGVDNSHVDGRLSRLEGRHRMLHGSLEEAVLNRVTQLLWRQTSEFQEQERTRLKELHAQKRKRQIEERQRRGALRRRLLSEKCMTMAEIIDRRSSPTLPGD